MNKTQHYVLGKWTSATGEGKASYDAVTGEFIAETSVEGLDIPAILHYGRTAGSMGVYSNITSCKSTDFHSE